MKIIIKAIIIYTAVLIFTCFPQQPGWEIIPSGANNPLNSVFFYDYEVGFACGDSGLVIKSVDSGKTWQAVQSPTTFDLNDLYLFHRDTVLVVGDSGSMFFSDDGGSSWSGGSNFIPEDILSVSFSYGKGVCGCISQTILYCSYTGTSLSCATAQTGFFGGGFWGAVMLSPEIGFIAGENSIFQPLLGMTTDSGLNWAFHAFYLDGNEGRATGVDFTDMFIGYVSARVWDGRGAIAKTSDSGSYWVTTFFNNPLWDLDFPISATGLIGYTVGDSGKIYKTLDAGLNWQIQQSGTSVRLNGIHFLDLDNGFVVGDNGTLLRTTTGGDPITLVEDISTHIVDFKLEQNYPNPFNPTTNIGFRIAERGFVILVVYDALGNEVATLVNEEKSAGEYEVEFNISNLSGGISTKGGYASSVYFYQLKSGKFIEAKKMILIQ